MFARPGLAAAFAAAFVAAFAVAGCRTDNERAVLGPDCGALIEAARNAEACDPALGQLASYLEREGDEPRCRAAVRELLGEDPTAPPAIRSVYARLDPSDGSPLSTDELAALRELPRPATITVVPDVPPEPGTTKTRANVDGVELVRHALGPLRTTIRPGPRTLMVHHGGKDGVYCVDLRPCDPVTLTAHGAKIGRHPDVRPGPC